MLILHMAVGVNRSVFISRLGRGGFTLRGARGKVRGAEWLTPGMFGGSEIKEAQLE